MIKYRVMIKVGYCDAWFEFDGAESACAFAENALKHSVKSKDTDKETHIDLSVIEEESNAETV